MDGVLPPPLSIPARKGRPLKSNPRGKAVVYCDDVHNNYWPPSRRVCPGPLVPAPVLRGASGAAAGCGGAGRGGGGRAGGMGRGWNRGGWDPHYDTQPKILHL